MSSWTDQATRVGSRWSALGEIVTVVVDIDTQAGPVVLQHGSHGQRIVQGRGDVGKVALAHRRPLVLIEGVPRVRIGVDDRLGVRRACEEEPVPPLRGEPGIHALVLYQVGQTVEHAQRLDPVRVVEGSPVSHALPAIVADHRERRVSEAAHDGGDVARHGTVAVRLVVGRAPASTTARSHAGPDRRP